VLSKNLSLSPKEVKQFNTLLVIVFINEKSMNYNFNYTPMIAFIIIFMLLQNHSNRLLSSWNFLKPLTNPSHFLDWVLGALFFLIQI